jgi:hypothetical protein
MSQTTMDDNTVTAADESKLCGVCYSFFGCVMDHPVVVVARGGCASIPPVAYRGARAGVSVSPLSFARHGTSAVSSSPRAEDRAWWD